MNDSAPQVLDLLDLPVSIPGPGELYVRVPLSWLADAKHGLQQRSRLLLLLIYETRGGRRRIRVTPALAARAGLSRKAKRQCLAALERDGVIRVVQIGQAAPIVELLPKWENTTPIRIREEEQQYA